MENLEKCPVCESTSFRHHLEIKDYSVSKEVFNTDQCTECGFIFTNPRPTKNDIGKYYQSEEYISHTNSNQGLINKLYHLVRNYTLKQKLTIINNVNPQKGNLLDVGCGTGYFLTVCKKDGWKIHGMEPDEKARNLAIKNTNEKILSNIHELKSEKFDIITLWHVLEHIHDLKQDFYKLTSHLNPKGKIIIAVPNCNSYDAITYKDKWAAYDVPRHLYHFTQDSINTFFKKNSFTCIKTLPMYFDSFYVSLLSEKYKTGKSNLLNGFINGLISNLKAKNNNYSSIIYIAERKDS